MESWHLKILIAQKAVPKTKVGHDSILAVRPFKNIWWRKRTVSAFRKIEFVSSWVQGGFLLLAAILKGRRKQDTRISNCSTYSSSDSTMRNTKLHIWSVQIFFGKFMYLWWEKLALPISLPHGFRMRRSDVLVYDLFPASATEPSPEKALHLFDFSYVWTTHPQPLHLRVDDVISVQRRSPTTAKNVLPRTATCAVTRQSGHKQFVFCKLYWPKIIDLWRAFWADKAPLKGSSKFNIASKKTESQFTVKCRFAWFKDTHHLWKKLKIIKMS